MYFFEWNLSDSVEGVLNKGGCWKVKTFTAMNRWLDFTEQILRKVHWTCSCAQSQEPNLRGGAKYAKYAGDGGWAWCKTKYAKQLFVYTRQAGYWLVRRKKKTSCWQIPFWLCASSWLPIWVDQNVRLLHIFIEFKLLSHYCHICCIKIFGRDWNICKNMYFVRTLGAANRKIWFASVYISSFNPESAFKWCFS